MRVRVFCAANAPEPVAFAAQELEDYLNRMLPRADRELRFTVSAAGCDAADGYTVRVGENGGKLIGRNPRSALLAVYDYLRRLGCRFLAPGKGENEVVPCVSPEQLSADYTRKASFAHRGVCIEGADSVENILSYIDWLPKVGYNTFFLQFKTPWAFLHRWYAHLENPLCKAESFTPEDALRAVPVLERAVQKRGLLLHRVGHGWTGETLGYAADSWDAAVESPTEEKRRWMAQVNGKRALWMGIPANTNLCLSNPDTTSAFVRRVVDFAERNPTADYIHVWLADEYNNVCECPACSRTTISDQYIALLNEIDRCLTARGLETKIVFLLYQELLWPPKTERLNNPERFILMFAPISRTFSASYTIGSHTGELPPYHRNKITLPSALSENLAFLRAWKEIFSGDSFDYDYPLGRAHYGDFGYLHIARLIASDIRQLNSMGLNGYISCQELRAALPNALPNYVMGYTLFDENVDTEGLIDEYFAAAYGAFAPCARTQLEALSAKQCCDYLNGKGERQNAAMAERLEAVIRQCKAFSVPETETGLFPRLLNYHNGYVLRLASAMAHLAREQNQEAEEAWDAFRGYICVGETAFQPYLDVYRVLEVTGKYTGFLRLVQASEKEKHMHHEYYSYSARQLSENAKLPVAILSDNAAVFRAMADEMADEIIQNNKIGKRTVFICPVGPVGQYPYFVERVNRERISLKNVWFFNMDEYLTDDGDYIDRRDSLSFRGFMDRTVYTKIAPELIMPPEQRVFPDPHDPERVGKWIDELGGVDICFGGIGINGHLAFNEAQPELTAEQFAALDTRVLHITPETRTANAIGDLNGALEDMPKLCVTIGIKEILASRKVRIGCFRDWHRAVVRRACCGEVSGAFPASLLQKHPDALLRITEFVANLPE